MKKDWTYKKLGEVTKIKTGKLDANASSEDGIYPFFTCSKEPLRISSYSYDCECVLVAGNGDLNVKYYKGKFDAYQRTYIIETTPDSGVMTYYMYHFFNKYIETLRQKSIGGIIKYIKLGDLTEATIPIPPISIQESIVRELDAIHGILEKKQEQLRELDNLAQAIFYDMFGDPITNPKQWEVKKLGEVGENGLTYGSGASAVDFDGKVRYVRITDIREDGTLNDNIMSPNSIEDKYLLNEGDLLFARSGATVGKTYLHVKNDMDYIYAGYLIRLIPNKEIVNPLYLFHITKTQYYLEFIKSTQRAVAQPNINAKQYSNLTIPLPPLSLQQSFAAKVSAIEVQKQAITQSIKETEALLAQRMDTYFS